MMIYIAQCETGAIKIGVTNNIHRRLRQFNDNGPHQIDLVFHAPGDAAAEKALLNRLAPFRIRGEWFRNIEECRRRIGIFLRQELTFPHAGDFYPNPSAGTRASVAVHVVEKKRPDGSARRYYYHRATRTRLPEPGTKAHDEALRWFANGMVGAPPAGVTVPKPRARIWADAV